MNDTTFHQQFSDIPEESRLLLAAGLAKLAEDITDRHPMLDTITKARASLVAGTILTSVPDHVAFDEPALQEMLSYLSDSQYWTVYWERSEYEDGKYALVGEVSFDGDVATFPLADGLEGSTRFFLSQNDAAFADGIRAYVRLWAPSTTDELHVSVVELPIAWPALDAVIREGESLDSYLARITSPAGISGTMTRGALGDIHSKPELEEAEYAGVTTLVIDSRRNLEALPAIIADYEAGLVGSPAPSIR